MPGIANPGHGGIVITAPGDKHLSEVERDCAFATFASNDWSAHQPFRWNGISLPSLLGRAMGS
jgi:hypothetical protein